MNDRRLGDDGRPLTASPSSAASTAFPVAVLGLFVLSLLLLLAADRFTFGFNPPTVELLLIGAALARIADLLRFPRRAWSDPQPTEIHHA